MSESVIQIGGVSKAFGDVQALEGVSFDVPQGSVFGLLGKNGAGKTTLFSVIAQFLRADAGTVSVLGQDVRHISELAGRMTILPQDAMFQHNIPILHQLAFFRRLAGRSQAEAEVEVMTSLERVGLEEVARRSAHTLSHGMHKRLGIAQAFLGEPEVILLDEPTAGLDPANARQIRDLVQEFTSSGSTIVISSHNMAEIQQLCDHVAILNDGELLHCGSVEALTRSDQRVEFELKRPLPPPVVEALEAVPGVARIETLSGAAQYSAAMDLAGSDQSWESVVTQLLRTMLDKGAVPRRLTEGASLENFFLGLTADDEAGDEPQADAEN